MLMGVFVASKDTVDYEYNDHFGTRQFDHYMCLIVISVVCCLLNKKDFLTGSICQDPIPNDAVADTAIC